MERCVIGCVHSCIGLLHVLTDIRLVLLGKLLLINGESGYVHAGAGEGERTLLLEHRLN